MNLEGVWFLLGRLLMVLTVALLVPGVWAAVQGGPEARAFFIAAVIIGVAGVTLQQVYSRPDQIRFSRREAFVLVTSAWLTASIVGAVPYFFIKGPTFIVDALFESASGFTTTGATVLTDIASEPPGLILWRSLTQWLGGMGIIVLGIAILPKLAVGGMELLGAEAPGPIQEKLTPRIAQTAKALWAIYALITGSEVLVLLVLGMTPFEAVNHAFTTMATGGFSTLDSSVGGFGRPAIEWAIAFFMMLAGANFALHFQVLRGKPLRLLRDFEFRCYAAVLLVASAIITADLLYHERLSQVFEAARHAVFQVVSIVTTTGYATTDFDAWPEFSRTLLFLLMFIGGCAGSTGGSVKVIRIVIVVKALAIHLRRFVQPRAVLPVRVGPRTVPDDVVASVTVFFILFLGVFAVVALLLTLFGLDMVTAFSASAACIGNIGPGFAEVGATKTFAPLPPAAKLLLFVEMIVGRLELYTVMVLLFLRRRR